MQIRVNGKWTSTTAESLEQLRHSLYRGGEDMLTLLDGVEVQKDIPLWEGAEIIWAPRGILPEREIWEQILAARYTPEVYARIRDARVAVAGLGGLGSQIALHLARTGIGHLHLVDFDAVEPGSLNRQQYGIRHLGMAKTEAMARQIEEINPYIQVKAEQVRVTAQNVETLFERDHVVCVAFDRPEEKAMLVGAVREMLPQKSVVAASGIMGTGSGNAACTRRIGERLYLCGDGKTGNERGRKLLSPRVGICAGHQANAVLQIILGELEP